MRPASSPDGGIGEDATPTPVRKGRRTRRRVVAAVISMLSNADAGAEPPEFCSNATTIVVDDFKSSSIDARKWKIDDPAGLLSQRDGKLLYNGTIASGAKLSAREVAGPGFFILKFHDFYTSNHSPGGRHEGSYGALGLGVEDNFVRIMRGAVRRSEYFEANHFVHGAFNIWYVPGDASEGMLGLRYDGSAVTFFYNTGSDPSRGWIRIGPAVTPGWSAEPGLFFSANPGATGITRLAIDSITRVLCTAP
jgi:hypothetical protein